MMTTCAVCGKRFVIMWPEHYVYKKEEAYFCSQDCMIVYKTKLTREASGFTAKRKEETEDMNHKLTKEIKKRAVEIAMEGGDFIGYLKKNGAKNPSAAWWYIKETLSKADPEKHLELLKALAASKPMVEIAEKLPPEAVAEVPEEVETVSAEVKLEEIEEAIRKGPAWPSWTPEGVAIDAQGMHSKAPFEFTVTAIRTDLGEFKKDSRNGLIYWTTEEGEKVILTHREWNKLAESIPQIMEVLGGAE